MASVWKPAMPTALLLGTFILYGTPEQPGTLEPAGLYLTWTEDPTSTIVIDWHVLADSPLEALDYRRRGAFRWRNTAAIETFPFPFTEGRTIHRAHLSGLRSGTVYEFRFGTESRIYSFRTMPETADEPIRIAFGGDVMVDRRMMESMNREVMRYDPDLIVWGGDLAYADGREDKAWRWVEYFTTIRNTLVTADGRVVPILSAIGNHEVRGGYHWAISGYTQTDASRAAAAPYYYTFFAMPGQPGYGVLDFGDYMTIILLDTDHTNPIAGAQTEWLERTLAAREHFTHIFPVYHIPAWPSVRPFEGSSSTALRLRWVPLFERYGVRMAFENHDHSYKRTVPLRGNAEVVDGIVYIGDGAWGVPPREVKPVESTWYLERSESMRNAVIVTIHGDLLGFVAIDPAGKTIDEMPLSPPVAKLMEDQAATEPRPSR